MSQLPSPPGAHRVVTLVCAIVAATGSSSWAGSGSGTSRTYTTNADFDEGEPFNVNHDIADQLQLNVAGQPGPFPIVNVAASGRGTLIRIDAETGAILGEYATSPDALQRNPSRTATDTFGNVWVGNRNESGTVGGVPRGSVVKIGICLGGTRVDANGQPDPNGQFLLGPFSYNTCVDRDGDGLIRTSRGLGNVLQWPDVTDGVGGADGIVEDALDEAIIVYQRVSGVNVHHVSFGSGDNVWVGGFPFVSDDFNLLDGQTGAILQTVPNPMCGAYGGIVDRQNVLWSTTGEGGTELLRFDLVSQVMTCIDLTQFGPNNTGENHGLGLGADGSVWVTQFDLDQILKFHPDGTLFAGFPQPTLGDNRDRSVAITPSDLHAWVDGSLGNRVSRLDANGNFLKAIDLGADGQSPRGMAVDSRGKVWTTCTFSATAKRIDPNAGADGLGEVDLTVPLGRGASPFNFSEMTGTNAVGTPQDNGTWQVRYDSGVVGNEYGVISWTSAEPAGTSLLVEFRASNDPVVLQTLPFQTAQNGVPFSGVFGRFVDIRVTFTRPPGSTDTPILFDLTIEGLTGGPEPDCPVGIRKPASLLVFPEFDNRSGNMNLVTVTNTNADFNEAGTIFVGTVDVEFVYIGKFGLNGTPLDCAEFNRTHRLTPNDTLTVVTRIHNPNQEQGFVYAFAKSPVTGQAIVFNHLTGNALILNGMDSADYSFNPYAFFGVGATGTPTDVDGDGVRDLNNIEYTCTPDVLLFPRFFGQQETLPPGDEGMSHLDFQSDLVLLNLTGGTAFTAVVDFLLYNDNEEVFSAQTSFDCWVKLPLLEINGAFGLTFLQNTNHAPNELLGFPAVETGWFLADGRLATSSAAVLQDPSILGLLVERLPTSGAAADLPFETGSQVNGDLLLLGPFGDDTP